LAYWAFLKSENSINFTDLVKLRIYKSGAPVEYAFSD